MFSFYARFLRYKQRLALNRLERRLNILQEWKPNHRAALLIATTLDLRLVKDFDRRSIDVKQVMCAFQSGEDVLNWLTQWERCVRENRNLTTEMKYLHRNRQPVYNVALFSKRNGELIDPVMYITRMREVLLYIYSELLWVSPAVGSYYRIHFDAGMADLILILELMGESIT